MVAGSKGREKMVNTSNIWKEKIIWKERHGDKLDRKILEMETEESKMTPRFLPRVILKEMDKEK